MTTSLKVTELSKTYTTRKFWRTERSVTVLEPLSFSLGQYKTLAIVGEVGSGKSTLAKLLVGAETPTTGTIKLNNQLLASNNFKQRCQNIRLIFQNSSSTLNPSLTIKQLLTEPLELNTHLTPEQQTQLIAKTLHQVGLLSEHMNFYPHMFSEGQKQRISLARAIILQPRVIILDEALASLDPSLRSQMINLLIGLQQEMGLSYILISHNLGIVRHLSDDMLVLQNGKVVEHGPTLNVLSNPRHKCTQKLIMSQHFLTHKV